MEGNVPQTWTKWAAGGVMAALLSGTALAAMPARYVLERADWQGAAKLPITKSAFPMADAITRFTRGLGMAPMEIAKRLIENLPPMSEVEKVTTAPPGFINFTLGQRWLASQEARVAQAAD